MGVWLKRQVVWRAIVTPRLKEELARELQAAADEIQQRIDQLEFSTKAYLTNIRADLSQALEIRRQIEAEKKRQEQARDEILKRKEEVEQLAEGSEVVRGILEGWVEVNVGDNLLTALAGVEIVTKDGVVVEIREREPAVAPPVAAAAGPQAGQADQRQGRQGQGPSLIIQADA